MSHRVTHLALGGLVVATPFGLWTSDALGQTYSIVSFTPAVTATTLVMGGSTVTETLSPSGSFSPAANVMHSPSVTYTVKVKCVDGPGNHHCSNSNMVMVVKDTGGSGSSPLSSLVNFTLGPNSQTVLSTSGSGSTLTMTLSALANSASNSFNIGFGAPILTSGSTGVTVSRLFSVAVGLSASGLGAASSGTFSAMVWHPIAVGVTSNMNFGKILSPKTGTATYTLSPAGTLTASGGGAAFPGSGATAAAFSVTGEGAQMFQLSVPASFTMVGGATLTVTTTTSFGGTGSMTTQSFLGSIGTLGSFPFQVGGLLPVAAGTPSGSYTGSLVVSVNYN